MLTEIQVYRNQPVSKAYFINSSMNAEVTQVCNDIKDQFEGLILDVCY